MSKPHRDSREIVLAFVNAGSWAKIRRMVEAQARLLLSSAADEVLAKLLADYDGDAQAEVVLQSHRELLLHCRETGIEEAFAELEAARNKPRCSPRCWNRFRNKTASAWGRGWPQLIARRP